MHSLKTLSDYFELTRQLRWPFIALFLEFINNEINNVNRKSNTDF